MKSPAKKPAPEITPEIDLMFRTLVKMNRRLRERQAAAGEDRGECNDQN